MEEVITQETLPDGSQLNPADGGGADEAGSISLEDLSKVLGKEYKDAETALKSVKDTFNYVGDVGKVKNLINDAKSILNTDEAGVLNALNKLMEEPLTPSPTPEAQTATPAQPSTEGFITRDQYQEDMFFSRNQDLSEVKDILTPLKNATPETKSMSWENFVATDNAKKVVDTFTGYKQVQSEKSVLESNPRLGAVTDRLTEARNLVQEAQTTGNVTQAVNMMNTARESAVASVLEAYDLK